MFLFLLGPGAAFVTPPIFRAFPLENTALQTGSSDFPEFLDIKSVAFSLKFCTFYFFFKLGAEFLPLHYISQEITSPGGWEGEETPLYAPQQVNGKSSMLSVTTSRCAKLQGVATVSAKLNKAPWGLSYSLVSAFPLQRALVWVQEHLRVPIS